MMRRAGVLASVGASVLFGVTFLLPPHLQPLDAEQILAFRILITIPVLGLLFLAVGAWADVLDIVRRCSRRPALVLVLVLDASLLGVQLWLFGWGPRTGHGLPVSLGYLVLPLVMVLVGVLVYREPFSRLRVAATLTAATGVVAAVVLQGGLGWPTLVVAAGLPVYLAVRRRSGLDGTGALLLELVCMIPFAAVTLTVTPSWSVVASEPALLGGLGILGLVSAAGFTLYLTASRVLPFAVFGVLSYLEPVLLVVVSVTALGESLHLEDLYTYVPICLALVLLAVEARQARGVDQQPHPDGAGSSPALVQLNKTTRPVRAITATRLAEPTSGWIARRRG